MTKEFLGQNNSVFLTLDGEPMAQFYGGQERGYRLVRDLSTPVFAHELDREEPVIRPILPPLNLEDYPAIDNDQGNREQLIQAITPTNSRLTRAGSLLPLVVVAQLAAACFSETTPDRPPAVNNISTAINSPTATSTIIKSNNPTQKIEDGSVRRNAPFSPTPPNPQQRGVVPTATETVGEELLIVDGFDQPIEDPGLVPVDYLSNPLNHVDQGRDDGCTEQAILRDYEKEYAKKGIKLTRVDILERGTAAQFGYRSGDEALNAYRLGNDEDIKYGRAFFGQHIPLNMEMCRVGIVGSKEVTLFKSDEVFPVSSIGMAITEFALNITNFFEGELKTTESSQQDGQYIEIIEIFVDCNNKVHLIKRKVFVPNTPTPKASETVTNTPEAPETATPTATSSATPVQPDTVTPTATATSTPTSTSVVPPPPPTQPPPPPTAPPAQPTKEIKTATPVVETPVVPNSPTPAPAQTSVGHLPVPTATQQTERQQPPSSPTAANTQREEGHRPVPTLAPVQPTAPVSRDKERAAASPANNPTPESKNETGPVAPTAAPAAPTAPASSSPENNPAPQPEERRAPETLTQPERQPEPVAPPPPPAAPPPSAPLPPAPPAPAPSSGGN